MNVLELPLEGQGEARSMQVNGASVSLDAFAPAALAALGRNALLGFRPETAICGVRMARVWRSRARRDWSSASARKPS